METVLELKYTPEDMNYICPNADTGNCGGKNNCTYKSRKGIADYIRRKYSASYLGVQSMYF